MRVWKLLGLAGLAGVAATGAVLVRNERRRRSYTPDDVRDRLHARYATLAPSEPVVEPAELPPPTAQELLSGRTHRVARLLRCRMNDL